MSEFPPSLSPQGLVRREAILEMALSASRRRRRRRIWVQAGAVVVLLIAITLPVLRSRLPSTPVIGMQHQQANSVPPLPQTVLITRIETDPHIVERLSIPSQPSHVTVIGDRELLRELAEAQQPAGLAYVNGKAMLLFR